MTQQVTLPEDSVSSDRWNLRLNAYKTPSLWRSVFQVLNTAAPFFLIWSLMLKTLGRGYGMTLLLSVPAAFFLVRLFILQHDCGHGSLFKSRTVNETLGFIIGVLTLVPYTYWKKTHAIHHATSGNLDERNYGEIDTLSVREYLSLPKLKRLLYRLYRHPLTMLIAGPAYQFILKHRYPGDAPRSWRREWVSVHMTNLVLLLVIAVMGLTIGFKKFVMIQLPITLLAGSIGVFLFYVQHQYENTYWSYQETWSYYDAALKGSSHLVLPKVLQWLTGNIGLHHIHHLDSRIPNYYLQSCYDQHSVLQKAPQLGLRQAFKTLWLSLWDEDEERLVGFGEVGRIRRRLMLRSGGNAEISPTKREAIPRSWRTAV